MPPHILIRIPYWLRASAWDAVSTAAVAAVGEDDLLVAAPWIVVVCSPAASSRCS